MDSRSNSRSRNNSSPWWCCCNNLSCSNNNNDNHCHHWQTLMLSSNGLGSYFRQLEEIWSA